jgi:hypothetical protein
MDGRDPRLIPLGGLLRATGMDELPQLLNVARGEMSLVGPRPCTSYEFENYQPWQLERFNGLPGLTGLWQVSGKNKTTFTEMVKLDINYVRTASPWLDSRIILKTFPTLINQVLDKVIIDAINSIRRENEKSNKKEAANERTLKNGHHRLRVLGTESHSQLQGPGGLPDENDLRRKPSEAEAPQVALSGDPGRAGLGADRQLTRP